MLLPADGAPLCMQRLAAANAAGMNIMRFFNGGEGSEVAALVTSPGAVHVKRLPIVGHRLLHISSA